MNWVSKLLVFAAVALFLTPGLAQADHGRRDRGRARVNVVVRADFGRHSHGRAVYHRGPYYSHYPRGWSRGRKVGWRHRHHHDCGHAGYFDYGRPRRLRGGVIVHIPF